MKKGGQSGQTKTYECSKCGKIYSTSSNLNKHIKNCRGNYEESVSSNEEQENSNSFSSSSVMDMLSKLPQIMQRMKELEDENKMLKNEVKEKNNEIQSSILNYNPPYDHDQLIKSIYKYNPYTSQYSIRSGGYTPKDYRNWYVLKFFNILDYPDTRIQFYKNCLSNILNNIPTDKLPYKIRDYNRHMYDIYNYSEQRWIKGKTKELVNLTIKRFLQYIHHSFQGALNIVVNELTLSDFKALENRNVNIASFNRIKLDIQSELNNKYSLPEYDDLDDEEIEIFYKKNFVKVLTDRLKNNEIDDEEIQEETNEPRIIEIRNRITTEIKYDDDDEGYNTDTDVRNNPYFD